ncbi:ragulator complex protein LAMTOR4 homolog [Cylas formicarius]|uniref:ragulator complex protein LAMTOR4 homolog n=1 Tax=Cylas formicarius TaxID=197179 RepID=UPI002958A3B1|nr:ragulator complex protein LAMTOR4 homolog [Cylas formicarius]
MDRPSVVGQTGYLVLNSEGAVLTSGGDLDNDERVAGLLYGLLKIARKLFDNPVLDESFKRFSVIYDDHAYVVCLSNRKVYIVKRQLQASDNAVAY